MCVHAAFASEEICSVQNVEAQLIERATAQVPVTIEGQIHIADIKGVIFYDKQIFPANLKAPCDQDYKGKETLCDVSNVKEAEATFVSFDKNIVIHLGIRKPKAIYTIFGRGVNIATGEQGTYNISRLCSSDKIEELGRGQIHLY